MPRRTTAIQPRKKGAVKKAAKLTVQQQAFVAEVLADPAMNPTQAAIRAGYKKEAASQAANKLMKDPVIAQMIGNALRQRLERTEITQDEVLNFLINALFLDPMELFDSTNGILTLKNLEQIPPQIRRLITKMEVKSRTINEGEDLETTVKLEWVSKELVLQLCMRHLGMISPDINKTNVQVNVNTENEKSMIQRLRESVASRAKVIDGAFITKAAAT
jgi:phage terminase small subunit